jgi:hypothetical protein
MDDSILIAASFGGKVCSSLGLLDDAFAFWLKDTLGTLMRVRAGLFLRKNFSSPQQENYS